MAEGAGRHPHGSGCLERPLHIPNVAEAPKTSKYKQRTWSFNVFRRVALSPPPPILHPSSTDLCLPRSIYNPSLYTTILVSFLFPILSLTITARFAHPTRCHPPTQHRSNHSPIPPPAHCGSYPVDTRPPQTWSPASAVVLTRLTFIHGT